MVASYAEDQLVTTNPEQLLELEAERRAFEQELETRQAESAGVPNEEKKRQEILETTRAEGEALEGQLES